MSETPVAWTAMPYRAPVVNADGTTFGTAESLMGDEAEDIFHGIAVKLTNTQKLVEISAAQIARVTDQRVYTTLTPAQIAELPPYHPDRWFHLGWGGLFQKHPMWEKG